MEFKDRIHPILIDPLRVTSNSCHFTCSGAGLVHDGHGFDPAVEEFLPLLEPLRTQKGTIRVRQPRIEKKPVAYWKAQCAFRNLAQSGSISDFQKRLREGPREMSTELAKIETRLNKEFRKRNDLAKDEKWKAMETHEEKAEMDATRFLREQFLTQESKTIGQSDNGVVVLKTWDRSEIHVAAEDLDLCHESVDAPIGVDGSRPSVNRWIVVGKDESAVYRKLQEIRREAVRARQRVEDARIERIRKISDDLAAEAKRSGSKAAWDVTGSWAIKCPYIEEQYGHLGQYGDPGQYGHLGESSNECSLNIHFSQNSEGKHMWAEFDFMIYTGVFRFINPAGAGRRSNNPPSAVKSGIQSKAPMPSKRPRSDDEDEEDEDEEYDEEDDDSDGRRTPTPKEFFIATNAKPSPSCPKWDYRWRGEETGEGEIALYSDEKLCSITFGGSGGTKLFGIFESDLTPKIEFTGLKIGKGATRTRKDIDEEWSSRNERAHKRAEVGRW